jgi:hypothetical protein
MGSIRETKLQNSQESVRTSDNVATEIDMVLESDKSQHIVLEKVINKVWY